MHPVRRNFWAGIVVLIAAAALLLENRAGDNSTPTALILVGAILFVSVIGALIALHAKRNLNPSHHNEARKNHRQGRDKL